ncbi:MAG: nucleotide exchange factor GrpE, partial [Oxalobacter sp.]|nr:nucleotide exchange factor GrpE [Oxalobacter sp.]
MSDTKPENENLNPETAEVSAEAETPVEETVQEESLESKLAAAEQKAAEMQDAFLRAKAESENIRRHAQEDIAKAHKFAVEGFAKAMLAVKDSMEMALKTDAPTVESIKSGVEATLRQLNQVFEQNRVVEVEPQQGDKLDPNKHQAISTVQADQEDNTIVSVLQKGYTLSDRLL